VSQQALPVEAREGGEGGESGPVGQIVEFTPSLPRHYYLVLIADAGSVPCSTTIKGVFPNLLGRLGI
jgi:hypothetical protein